MSESCGPEGECATDHGHDHGVAHSRAAEAKGWDWTRTLRAVAIASWGLFLVYLWVSGRATTYIGAKTE